MTCVTPLTEYKTFMKSHFHAWRTLFIARQLGSSATFDRRILIKWHVWAKEQVRKRLEIAQKQQERERRLKQEADERVASFTARAQAKLQDRISKAAAVITEGRSLNRCSDMHPIDLLFFSFFRLDCFQALPCSRCNSMQKVDHHHIPLLQRIALIEAVLCISALLALLRTMRILPSGILLHEDRSIPFIPLCSSQMSQSTC